MATDATSDNDEEFEHRLQNLREFDLSPVTRRLEIKGEVEDAEQLEKKFRRYAKMLLENPDKEIPPTPEIDEFWHALILDTVRYEQFCDEVFGEFLHHVPGDPHERDADAYAERVEQGEADETDAHCHPTVDE